MIKFIGNIINKVMKLFSYDAANDWQQHPEYPWMEINGNLVWRVNIDHPCYWKGFEEKNGAAFNKLNRPSKTPKQILELAIKICEDYSEDKYKLYKGYPPYKGDEPERAWEYTEGMCDGAEQCADKLRELLEELNK